MTDHVRMGGGLAGEVARVEFGEGGVDIVEVEPDTSTIRSSASISRTPSDIGAECIGR